MAKRRILLADLMPAIPQPPDYAVWSDTDRHNGRLGTDNLSFQHFGISTWEGVRSDKNMNDVPTYWETTVGSLASGRQYRIGFSSGISPIGGNLDFDPEGSFPYQISVNNSGKVINGLFGEVADLGSALSQNDVIRHWLDVPRKRYLVALNNGPWVEAVIAYQPMWNTTHGIRAVTILSGTGAGVTVNFGQNPFTYDPPPGVRPGLYDHVEPIRTHLYVGSEGFSVPASGPDPAKEFLPRIAAEPDVTIERRVGCWVWGDQSRSSIGALSLVNPDGALDDWLTQYDWRDAWVRLYAGWEGDSFNQFKLWTQAVVDDVNLSRDRLTIRLLDSLALLDRALQPRLFGDETENEAVRGQPKPVTIGRPLNVTPVLIGWDQGLPIYQVASWPPWFGFSTLTNGSLVTEISEIYDRRDAFISTPPTDWVYYENAPDFTENPADNAPTAIGFKLTNVPSGPVTCDPVGAAHSFASLSIVWETADRIVDWVFRVAPQAYEQFDPVLGWITHLAADTSNITGWDQPLADYITEPRTALAQIRAVMDSFCGWVVPDREGVLQFGRIEAPSLADPIALELNSVNVQGVPDIDLDRAKGLTTRMSGRRNFTVMTDSDLANSVQPEDRPQFEQEYFVTVSAPEWQLEGSPYQAAIGAPAKTTLMQDEDDIRAEISRVVDIWSTTRHTVRLTALLDASEADELEPSQTVLLKWPRYGLDAGKPFKVIGVKNSFFSRRVELELWG